MRPLQLWLAMLFACAGCRAKDAAPAVTPAVTPAPPPVASTSEPAAPTSKPTLPGSMTTAPKPKPAVADARGSTRETPKLAVTPGKPERRLPAGPRLLRKGKRRAHLLPGAGDDAPPPRPRKTRPMAAPPPVGANIDGLGVIAISPRRAKVGAWVTVRASEPIPARARIKLGGVKVSVRRGEDGRSLRFRVPAGAKSGYVVVHVDDRQHTSGDELEVAD